MAKKLPLRKDYAIVEVDESSHTVRGTATSEVVDQENEICDYADTKPLYEAWTAAKYAATTNAGQDPSLGNVRLQHTMEIAGKVTGIEYLDDAKVIKVATQPVDDRIWKMVKGGFITGFSQGGGFVYRRCNMCGTDMGDEEDKPRNFKCPKCKKLVIVRYACDPAEISYVDAPCNEDATFDYIKADGTREVRKFAKASAAGPVSKAEAKTKRVAGEDLPASAFAYVGDPQDTSTWKLPIKFSTDTKTKSHIRNALARFGQTEGIPDGERPKVKAKILSAARRHGIQANGSKSVGGGMARINKGMYEVGTFARTLAEIDYLRRCIRSEGDYEEDEADIEIADEITENLASLGESLKQYVANEVEELTAVSKAAITEGVTKSMKPNELLKAAHKSMSAHFSKAAAHHTVLAEHHKSLHEEHMAAHETHKAVMEDDECKAMHGTHKALAAHHKAMAAHHEKIHKAHAKHAAHNSAMASAHDEAAEKAETVETTPAAPAVQKAATIPADPAKPPVAKEAPTPADPAKPADPAVATPADPMDISAQVQQMVRKAVAEAVQKSLSEVNNDNSIQEMVAKATRDTVAGILGQQVEKTGARITPPVVVHPLVKRGEAKPTVEKSAVPLDLQDLVDLGGAEDGVDEL